MTDKPHPIPDDIRREANHLAHQFHQKALSDDLATAIAKALWGERMQSAAIARAMPAQIEKEPGLFRRTTHEDIASAIMRVRN